jgi:hypothetical protein
MIGDVPSHFLAMGYRFIVDSYKQVVFLCVKFWWNGLCFYSNSLRKRSGDVRGVST